MHDFVLGCTPLTISTWQAAPTTLPLACHGTQTGGDGSDLVMLERHTLHNDTSMSAGTGWEALAECCLSLVHCRMRKELHLRRLGGVLDGVN